MNRRHSRSAYVLFVICLLLTSCAANLTQQRYDTARRSQISAEQTYQAIYRAYQGGKVTATTLDDAERRYSRWQVAQRAYIEAAQANRPNVDSEAMAMQQALQSLHTLAAELKVL